MAKAKSKSKAKVKKVRTPEEKAARKVRRKLRRESRKEFSQLSARIAEKSIADVASVTLNVTSDGLPFSQSIDNPFSLRAQLAAAAEEAKIEKEDASVAALANYRKPKFAGSVKEGILTLEA